MPFWSNLIGYQIAWFATVIAAARGFSGVGVAATSIFCLVNLALSHQRKLDLQLMSMALVLGVLSDGGLVICKLISFASPWPSIPTTPGAPLWILTLWMAFSVTLNRSLRSLQRRPWVAVAFGAIGGPLAYGAAARGWGALQFEPPQWRAQAWLGVSWAISMYLFTRILQQSKRADR